MGLIIDFVAEIFLAGFAGRTSKRKRRWVWASWILSILLLIAALLGLAWATLG